MLYRLKCKICQIEFEKKLKPSQLKWGNGKTCSKKCRYELTSITQRTGKWMPCVVCKKEFYSHVYSRKNGHGKFCSLQCFSKTRIRKQVISCLVCNKKVMRSLSHIKRGASFCGHDCLSRHMKKIKNHLWKGGITKKNALLRMTRDYRKWRKSVFERDNYTCQLCQRVGVKLHADHIKPFAFFPKLRLNINNGRTLCVDCHKKTPTYLKRYYLPDPDEYKRIRDSALMK